MCCKTKQYSYPNAHVIARQETEIQSTATKQETAAITRIDSIVIDNFFQEPHVIQDTAVERNSDNKTLLQKTSRITKPKKVKLYGVVINTSQRYSRDTIISKTNLSQVKENPKGQSHGRGHVEGRSRQATERDLPGAVRPRVCIWSPQVAEGLLRATW